MKKKPYKAKKVKLDKKFSMAAYGLTLIAAVAARTMQLRSNVNSVSYTHLTLPTNCT